MIVLERLEEPIIRRELLILLGNVLLRAHHGGGFLGPGHDPARASGDVLLRQLSGFGLSCLDMSSGHPVQILLEQQKKKKMKR